MEAILDQIWGFGMCAETTELFTTVAETGQVFCLPLSSLSMCLPPLTHRDWTQLEYDCALADRALRGLALPFV